MRSARGIFAAAGLLAGVAVDELDGCSRIGVICLSFVVGVVSHSCAFGISSSVVGGVIVVVGDADAGRVGAFSISSC